MPAKTELIMLMTVNGFVAAIDYIVVLVAVIAIYIVVLVAVIDIYIVVLVAVIDIVADRNSRSYAP